MENFGIENTKQELAMASLHQAEHISVTKRWLTRSCNPGDGIIIKF